MKSKSILILFPLALLSCQAIMMKAYGIKDPEVENEKTISKYALKCDMDASNIVTVNSSDFLDVMIGKSIPEGALYDKNGDYIEYRRTDTSCNAGLFDFIPALKLTDTYHQPDSADLDTELNKFRDLKGNQLKPKEAADFYLLIYWTTWTGKLNKNHVKVWEDLARANTNCKINVIKVNLDMQEYWEETERQKIMEVIAN